MKCDRCEDVDKGGRRTYCRECGRYLCHRCYVKCKASRKVRGTCKPGH